jgi:hypothetical protein
VDRRDGSGGDGPDARSSLDLFFLSAFGGGTGGGGQGARAGCGRQNVHHLGDVDAYSRYIISSRDVQTCVILLREKIS